MTSEPLNFNQITTVLFDYGGVLAEEGFQAGLMALGREAGLSPEELFQAGSEAVYNSGYVLGQGTEVDFWREVSRQTGLPPYRQHYTDEILTRFVLRPGMLQMVRQLKTSGLTLAVLSDQTDWLDRLEARDGFFHLFDRVFNSYHLEKGKRDPSIFPDVAQALRVTPGDILFIDDNPGHVQRARNQGLKAVTFTSEAELRSTLAPLLT